MSTTAPPRPPGGGATRTADTAAGEGTPESRPGGGRRPTPPGRARSRTGGTGGTGGPGGAGGDTASSEGPTAAPRRRRVSPGTAHGPGATAPVGAGAGAGGTVAAAGGPRVGPGPAAARAAEPQAAPSAEARPNLRLVERHRSVRPGLLGTVAVGLAFVALFVLAALQAALVQGQLRLDRLEAGVAEREEARNRLALQVNTLESPERLAEAARGLGMVPAPEVLFLYAPLPGASAPEVLRSGEPSRGGSRPAGLDQAESDAAAADNAAAAAAAAQAAAEAADADGDGEADSDGEVDAYADGEASWSVDEVEEDVSGGGA